MEIRCDDDFILFNGLETGSEELREEQGSVDREAGNRKARANENEEKGEYRHREDERKRDTSAVPVENGMDELA